MHNHCFHHELLPNVSLERIDDPTGRYYIRPENRNIKYTSVTNFLYKHFNTHDWLEKWKEQIGEDRANEISGRAKTRGTSLHSLYEKFLLNEDYKTNANPLTLGNLNQVKPYLIKSIDKVLGVETQLYSDKLLLAGTADAVVIWEGIPTILDFKTSRRRKKAEDIESYFLQTTIYSMMVEELYNIHIPQVLIIMTVDHDYPIFFFENTVNFRRNIKKIVNKFNENKNI